MGEGLVATIMDYKHSGVNSSILDFKLTSSGASQGSSKHA